MSTVFTDFLNNVDLAVNGFLIAGYDRVRDAATTPLRLCLSIYIAIYGLLLLTGYATLSVRGAFGKLAILLFVYVLATNADFYTGYLEQLFVQAPASIGNVLVGGGGTGSQNSAMDAFYTTGMDAGDKLWSRGNLYTLSPLFAAVVVYAITLGVAAYAAFLLALAKIALAVLLILTPLFALCYLYGHTRRLFEGLARPGHPLRPGADPGLRRAGPDPGHRPGAAAADRRQRRDGNLPAGAGAGPGRPGRHPAPVADRRRGRRHRRRHLAEHDGRIPGLGRPRPHLRRAGRTARLAVGPLHGPGSAMDQPAGTRP